MPNFSSKSIAFPDPLVGVLKGVSRSFYLSIRVLPQKLRPTVALAYLLARAADTLSDTPALPEDKRLRYLEDFRGFIKRPDSNAYQKAFSHWAEDLKPHDHVAETHLMQSLSLLFNLYQTLPKSHYETTQKVLLTLTEGMVNDLNFFAKSQEPVRCLPTLKETDQYTYWVAGCVGEFWTDLLKKEYLTHWNLVEMSQKGIDFGKGLQMINILQDLPRDFKGGRCYFSAQELGSYDLKTEDLVHLFDSGANGNETDSRIKLLNLYQKRTQSTRKKLQKGMEYARAIPARFLRLRLSVLWPLFIGLETLKALEKSNTFNKRVRIRRQQVYRMVFFTLLFAWNDRILYQYYLNKGGRPF